MEIRVHGIGGPTPESVLGEPRGAGTDVVQPHDRFGASGLRTGLDPSVGVYSWGPLTSGLRWFPLWPLALPFTVLNVTGYMHPGPKSRRATPARVVVVSLGAGGLAAAGARGWVESRTSLIVGAAIMLVPLAVFVALVLVAVFVRLPRPIVAGWQYVRRHARHGMAELEGLVGAARGRPRVAVLVVASTFAVSWKSFGVVHEWEWQVRVLLPLVVVVVTFLVVLWGREAKQPSLYEVRAESGSGLVRWVRVRLAILGLLSRSATKPDFALVGRVLYGVVAAGLAVWAAREATGPRLAFAGAAVALLAGAIAFARRKKWDGAVLWTVSPLVVVASSSAVAMEIGSGDGALTDRTLLDLLMVTALAEELIFRGAILGMAYRTLRTSMAAEWFTTFAFGCWHIGNALNGSQKMSPMGRAGWIAVTIVVTMIGGVMFSWMRHRTRSLLGPVATHTATNLPGLALRGVF